MTLGADETGATDRAQKELLVQLTRQLWVDVVRVNALLTYGHAVQTAPYST